MSFKELTRGQPAQTLLVSLWKVDDAATLDLMVDYYRRLLKGEGRSGALRAAQKAMIANPARQHPCYWAAFIPIGDWTPLPIGSTISALLSRARWLISIITRKA